MTLTEREAAAVLKVSVDTLRRTLFDARFGARVIHHGDCLEVMAAMDSESVE